MPELDADGNPINPVPNNEGGDDHAPPEDGTPVGGDVEPSFSKKQMEQLSTLVGRISKKQLEEHVIPLINRQPTPAGGSQTDDSVKAFNEKLQTMIFEGKVLEAYQLANDVQTRARTNISETQKTQTLQELTKFSDKPFYKEIYSEMKKSAEEVVGQGYPPEAAAEYGYFKAKSQFLETKLSGGDDEKDLGFVEGGRPPQRGTKVGKLPPQFQAAMERDIRDGLIKDEAEYRKTLHPSIRKAHNI